MQLQAPEDPQPRDRAFAGLGCCSGLPTAAGVCVCIGVCVGGVFCYIDPHLLFAFTQVALLPPSFHSGPGHLPCHLPGTGQALQVSPSLVSSPVYGPEAKSWAGGPL